MKTTLILFIIFMNTFLVAQVTDIQKELVLQEVTKIAQSIKVFEADLAESQQKLTESYQNLESVRYALQQNPSFWEVGKLKAKETYYEQFVDKYFNDVDKKTVQVAIYHCILFAYGNQEVSYQQIQADKIFFDKIQSKLFWAQKQQQTAEQRWESAHNRLLQIPQENQEFQKRIDELQKQLIVLETKKSWSNFLERTELKTKIGIEKGKLLKNEGELFAQNKIKEDSWQEVQSMLLEQAEAAVAIEVLQNN